MQRGELTYTDAVREGIYVALGAGDVDFGTIVAELEAAGFDGWYVFEQDTILKEEPGGEGPVADVRRSLEHLKALLSR